MSTKTNFFQGGSPSLGREHDDYRKFKKSAEFLFYIMMQEMEATDGVLLQTFRTIEKMALSRQRYRRRRESVLSKE